VPPSGPLKITPWFLVFLPAALQGGFFLPVYKYLKTVIPLILLVVPDYKRIINELISAVYCVI
jgi:hypothetical protein